MNGEIRTRKWMMALAAGLLASLAGAVAWHWSVYGQDAEYGWPLRFLFSDLSAFAVVISVAGFVVFAVLAVRRGGLRGLHEQWLGVWGRSLLVILGMTALYALLLVASSPAWFLIVLGIALVVGVPVAAVVSGALCVIGGIVSSAVTPKKRYVPFAERGRPDGVGDVRLDEPESPAAPET